MRKYAYLGIVALTGPVLLAATAGAADQAASAEERLKLARAFVARSDRYFSHDKLRRGMAGYGLTVMAGAKVEKFSATIVSVIENWNPRHAVILCRLGGLGLEKTGIVSGMSGSPVFIRDPADGKDKMIGAVAYGWDFQKAPICGVQPIAQMLAVAGAPLPGAKTCVVKSDWSCGQAGGLDPAFVQAVLNPSKVDFAQGPAPGRPAAGPVPGAAARMAPLSTPVMISGVRPRTMGLAEKLFRKTGMVPLQAGTVGGTLARAVRDARIEPGSGLAVTLVTGDADLSAVGTATEVLKTPDGGEYVLAFGHSFNADGAVDLPMGPAYVHAVIPSAYTSIKLGSTLKITGRLSDDENTGVGGRIGEKARMIPMTVTVRWGEDVQAFRYRLVRHNWLTAAMASIVMKDSLWANRDLPQLHTLDYSVDIDFGKLGRYRARNRSSDRHALDVGSDLTRPLAAMMNAEVGEPVFPERIDVRMTIFGKRNTASLLALELPRHTYKPGETIRGKAVLRPFRSRRISRDVSIQLPADLPEGRYTLTVCSSQGMLDRRKAEMPHRFDPRTVPDLFAALSEVVQPKMNHMYLHMALPDKGVAVRRAELDHLPGSLADVLGRTAPMDTRKYRRSLSVSQEIKYVLSGSASASFVVRKQASRNH
ncbi:MAG: hypothetical protein ACYS5V_01155 [Planctomycetota bacterium]|jgi:hypothetical protein